MRLLWRTESREGLVTTLYETRRFESGHRYCAEPLQHRAPVVRSLSSRGLPVCGPLCVDGQRQ